MEEESLDPGLEGGQGSEEQKGMLTLGLFHWSCCLPPGWGAPLEPCLLVPQERRRRLPSQNSHLSFQIPPPEPPHDVVWNVTVTRRGTDLPDLPPDWPSPRSSGRTLGKHRLGLVGPEPHAWLVSPITGKHSARRSPFCTAPTPRPQSPCHNTRGAEGFPRLPDAPTRLPPGVLSTLLCSDPASPLSLLAIE